jgi:uncharacterized repeat protein (TIGR02543 family)
MRCIKTSVIAGICSAMILSVAAVFLLAGCPEAEGKTVEEEVNTDALAAKITEAETLLGTIAIADSAAEIPTGVKYVSTTEGTSFKTAITAAKTKLSSTTQAAVDAALAALEGAITAFNTAIQAAQEGSRTTWSYTVSFNLNYEGAETNPVAITITNPNKKLLDANQSLPNPQRTGYSLQGWFTAADNTGTQFTANTIIYANVTLYAKWEAGEDSGPVDYTSTTPSVAGPDFTPPTAGKLVSKGPATGGATTYYVDYENGNDTNNGTTPQSAWKTFGPVNSRTFQPGDHILLEAHSVWNGTSVDLAHYFQNGQDGNINTAWVNNPGGMLWPKGSGTAGNPIVIDLYSNINGAISYEADQRPIINGNGTPSTNDTNPYAASGAVHLEGQDYWEIRNIEATNSFQFPDIAANPDLRNTHWYNRAVRKALLGIYVHSTTAHTHNAGILIEYCYSHDVQSEHNNNGNSTGAVSNSYFGTPSTPGKTGGGIIVEVTDSTVQYNIVRRTGLEGMRTNHGDSGYKIIFRGNYIETTAGDGMVTSRVKKRAGDTDSWGTLVESNIIKDACAAPNLGGGNYASNWCYYGEDILYQFNEGYGTLYGYLDGEAWDIDNASPRVVYQYNYSHHNAGGAILFMNSGNDQGVFRYNISANDGGGSRYLSTIANDVDGFAGTAISESAASYQAWDKGQSLIHYTIGGQSASTLIPVVYNNTFYIGDGVTTAIYGNTSTGTGSKYVRFYNNIVLKVGAGQVFLSNSHNPSGGNPNYVEGKILNDAGFKNNLLWAYETNPATGVRSKFSNGNGTSISQLQSQQSNVWKNPMLKIQIQGNVSGNSTSLREQRNHAFPENKYNDPDALKAFVSKDRLRRRASLFAPINASSPVIEKGMVVNANNMDGVTNFGPAADQNTDFFGQPVNPAKPPIGAAAGPYTP